MTLLICEDDALVALELEEQATRRGITSATVVANSVEAMQGLHVGAFRSAIVDLHLGDGRSGPHIFVRMPAPADIIVDCTQIGVCVN